MYVYTCIIGPALEWEEMKGSKAVSSTICIYTYIYICTCICAYIYICYVHIYVYVSKCIIRPAPEWEEIEESKSGEQQNITQQ